MTVHTTEMVEKFEQKKGDAGFASKLFAPLMQQLKGGVD